MELARKKLYTIEDIYALPEGQRAELIDGNLYMMAPPNRTHQDISMFLSTEIRKYFEKKKGDCRVYAAPFAVFLNENDTNYLEPDISVICDPDKLTDRGCTGAPDWVIEITSPGTQSRDYGVKLFKYRTAGVREYWIVNPKTKTVQVFDFEKEEVSAQYSFEEEVKVSIYEDLSIRLSDYL